MNQKIEQKIWREFQVEQKKVLRKIPNKISNSGRPKTQWMKKITAKIRISELASEHGITCCPICDYNLYFNDARGFFCCSTKKFGGSCNFFGNLVDFCKMTGCLG